MAKVDDVMAAASKMGQRLDEETNKHLIRMRKSIRNLQQRITNDLQATMSTTAKGQLIGPRVNLKQAQKVHQRLINAFDEEFGEVQRRGLTKSFMAVADQLADNFKDLNIAMDFTSVDKDMITLLRDQALAEFQAYGDAAVDRMATAMYDTVIARGTFAELVDVMDGILIGGTDARGQTMAQYSSLWANDAIMNYQQQVHLKKGRDAGLSYFLYFGNVMEQSRPFCIDRAGKRFSIKQIESWNGMTWQGKSGPPLTHRGGWNCRHHWQPIEKDWIPEEGLDIGDWFDETGTSVARGTTMPAWPGSGKGPKKPQPKQKKKFVTPPGVDPNLRWVPPDNLGENANEWARGIYNAGDTFNANTGLNPSGPIADNIAETLQAQGRRGRVMQTTYRNVRGTGDKDEIFTHFIAVELDESGKIIRYYDPGNGHLFPAGLNGLEEVVPGGQLPDYWPTIGDDIDLKRMEPRIFKQGEWARDTGTRFGMDEHEYFYDKMQNPAALKEAARQAEKLAMAEEGVFSVFETVEEADAWVKAKGITVNVAEGVTDAKKLQMINAYGEALEEYDKLGIPYGHKIKYNEFGSQLDLIHDPKGTFMGLGAEGKVTINTADEVMDKLTKTFDDNIRDIFNGDTPLYAITNFKDLMVHELGHNLYFELIADESLDLAKWQKYFDDIGWKAGAKGQLRNTPSFFGQEAATELWAESVLALTKNMGSGAEGVVKQVLDDYVRKLQKAAEAVTGKPKVATVGFKPWKAAKTKAEAKRIMQDIIDECNRRDTYVRVRWGDDIGAHYVRFRHDPTHWKWRDNFGKPHSWKADKLHGVIKVSNKSSLSELNTINRKLHELQTRLALYELPPLRGSYTWAASADWAANMGDGVMGLHHDAFGSWFGDLLFDKVEYTASIKKAVDQQAELLKTIAALEGKKSKAYRAVKEQLDLRKGELKKLTEETWEGPMAGYRKGEVTTWRPGDDTSLRPRNVREYYSNYADKGYKTMEHELGHHIHQQMFVEDATELYDEPPFEKWLDYFFSSNPATRNNIATMAPSKYALKNSHEWFAENYGAWHTGMKHLVNEELVGVMEGLDDLASGRITYRQLKYKMFDGGDFARPILPAGKRVYKEAVEAADKIDELYYQTLQALKEFSEPVGTFTLKDTIEDLYGQMVWSSDVEKILERAVKEGLVGEAAGGWAFTGPGASKKLAKAVSKYKLPKDFPMPTDKALSQARLDMWDAMVEGSRSVKPVSIGDLVDQLGVDNWVAEDFMRELRAHDLVTHASPELSKPHRDSKWFIRRASQYKR